VLKKLIESGFIDIKRLIDYNYLMKTGEYFHNKKDE